MKFEKTESLQPHHFQRFYSCFMYVRHGHAHGDTVYVGTECGAVSAYYLQAKSQHISTSKEEDLTRSDMPATRHHAAISCLMHSAHPRLVSGCPGNGLLFSGSKDGCVKCWESGGGMIQTLPHSSSVTALVDGKDGSLLSICVDGYLRMWSPQAGRDMLLHPFFECTHAVSVLNPQESWLSALAVNPVGHWTCFVGEGNVSISLYRKPQRDLNASEAKAAASQTKVSRHAHWESVHALSVTALDSVPEQGYVVSLSADCTCKVIDECTGATLYSALNPHKAMFTGLCFTTDVRYMLLADELGGLHKYDVNKEALVGYAELCRPNRPRKDRILNLHMDQMLGQLTRFRDGDLFLVLQCPPPKRASSQIEEPSLQHRHSAFPLGGEVALWKPLDIEGECQSFVAHEGEVVGLGVYTLNNSFGRGAGNPDAVGREHVAEQEDEEEDEARDHVAHVRIKGGEGAEGGGDGSGGGSSSPKMHDTHGKKRRNSLELSHNPMPRKGNEHIFQVSREEKALFSVATDRTVRCWDEHDASVTYTFKSKSRADMLCMVMLWGLNSLATGHENGMVTLWNADAGTSVSSRALKASLTCIVEARNCRSHILVGSDFSGAICVWSLTLFRINPIHLPVETMVPSKHSADDPGILSLAFHPHSRSFFSGGTDSNILAWKLDSDKFSILDCPATGGTGGHTEGVCSLNCSANFLLSGDEKGDMILWGISELSDEVLIDHAPLPEVTKLIHFNALNPNTCASAVLSLCQTTPSTAFLLQSSDGPDKVSVLWKVSEVDDAPAVEATPPVSEEVCTAAAAAAADSKTADTQESLQTEAHAQPEPEPGLVEYKVFEGAYPGKAQGKRLFVQELRELRHVHEIKTAELCQEGTGLVTALYFGTSAGPIFKYPCSFR